MSTVRHEAPFITDEPLPNLLFDQPGADIILRSQDSSLFRVPKIYIANGSPILSELIQKTLDSSSDGGASFPEVQLPESGEILYCLLTFIFPVTPLVPSTPEETMELLSVAQKYQMGTALTHIRGSVALQKSLFASLEPALHVYALAQKYGLRPEALQTARFILSKQSITIEDLDNWFHVMPGASLYELWRYNGRVRAILAPDLTEFMASGARGTIAGLRCTGLSSSQIQSWIDRFIQSIGQAPNLFDLVEFNTAMARHIKSSSCECASIPSPVIREFWEALTFVVDASFEKAESAFSLVRDREDSEAQINTAESPLEPFDVPDANLIILSSDLVNFRVHKPVLAMASPFFKDLLSLPQPSDSESVDGLPVIQFPESSELVNSLLSMLYPVRTVIPNSYEKVLYLLAVCQKYDMPSVQSSIRVEIGRGEFPAPKGTEAFTAYAIASTKELIPEMQNAARLTLDHPMTLDNLGNSLQMFEGWALRNLVKFRKRCRDNLIACFDPFMEVRPPGPSSIWVGCPEASASTSRASRQNRTLPRWLNQLLSRNQNDLKRQTFTGPLDIHSRIRREYFSALQNHASCNFCLAVHMRNGSTFCSELEDKLVQARDKESVGPVPSQAISLEGVATDNEVVSFADLFASMDSDALFG